MANFEAYEQFLKEATTPGPNRTLPGVVVAAVDATGITYTHASGTQSVDPSSPIFTKPFSLSTTMWIASCTKLLTSLACLQLVERGLLAPDEDISRIIPELATGPKGMKVFVEFENVDGKEIAKFKENIRPVTLRHLLSHSSGLAYAGFDPVVQRIYTSQGRDWQGAFSADTFFEDIFATGLKFEPGTSWTYGVGIDVAGLAVERLTGMRLGDYFQKEFFAPLGMKSTSFDLTESIKAERADMAVRVDGKVLPSPTRFFSDDDKKVQMGGAGLWSCAGDYTKILQAVLQKPSPLFRDEKTLDLAFNPCLTEESKAALNFVVFGDYPENKDGAVGSMFHGGTLPSTGTEIDYTMAGLSAVNGMEGKRGGAGKAISWGGLPNLIWCIDREKGKAAFYGSQLLPPGDRTSGAAFGKFEALVFGAEGAKL